MVVGLSTIIVTEIFMIKIRRAKNSEAKAIANIHILSWQATYQGLMPEEILNSLSLEKRQQEWHERLQAGVEVWVVEQKQNIIGFASVCPARDGDADPKTVAEISAIYLLPEHWNQGFGKQLCQIIFKNALNNNFQAMIAWVLETNKPACIFYEAMGFKATGDLKKDHIGCDSLRVVLYKKML